MGLGIAIGGGIILAVLVSMIVTVMMLISNGAMVQESMHDSFKLENKFQKTDFTFGSTSAESGLSGVSFELTNTGLEKLWNYDDSNLIITYDALINGRSTSVTETLSYYSGSNISLNCDGSNGGTIPAGSWSISQIDVDSVDPGLINSDEQAQVGIQLSYPLYTETSTISLTFVSELGKTITTIFYTDNTICPWYSPIWNSRDLIRINHVQVPGNLTNFPVLISITNSDLRDNAQADGDDILFTSNDKITKLNHEIEEYDDSDGTLIAWVNVPRLSSTTDTDIYMYYGNAGTADQQDITNTWNSNYQSIHHLHDDFLDSTSNNRDGTNEGSVDVPGKIGDGQDFIPADEIELGTWSVSGSSITIQAWINPDTLVDDGRIISKSNDPAGATEQSHVFMLSNYGTPEDELRGRLKTGTSDSSGTTTLFSTSSPLVAGTWSLAALTYDGSDMKLFYNGDEIKSVSKSGVLRENSWKIAIGNQPDNSDTNVRSWDGKIDEARISSVALSGDWLKTEYNNQNSPSTFYIVNP
jgi:hypothetical protein